VISVDKKIIEKYKLPLKDAFDYIGKKKPVSKRKQWTSNQRDKWMLREPNCPICKEAWSESNIMTKEHIHPIVLGGQDRDDNHVPLCQKCNLARNSVMVAVLGSSNILAIRNRMPALKGSIEEFVVWCHASINGDEYAMGETKHLTESFLQFREIKDPFSGVFPKEQVKIYTNQTQTSIIQRGRLFAKNLVSRTTTRKKKSEGESKTQVQCGNSDCKQPLNIPKGYLGGYRCPKCKFNHPPKESMLSINPTRDEHTTTSSLTTRDKNHQFVPIITSLLSDEEPTSLAKIAHELVSVMNDKGYEVTNVTQCLKLFDLPRGLKKAILSEMGDRIEITGSKTSPYARLLHKKDMNDDSHRNELILEAKKFLDSMRQNKVSITPLALLVEVLVEYKDRNQLSWSRTLEALNLPTTHYWDAFEGFIHDIGYSFCVMKWESAHYIVPNPEKITIKGFSTASKTGKNSLDFPSDPKMASEIIQDILKNRNIIESWNDLKKAALTSSTESKKRTTPVVKLFRKLYDDDGSDVLDWEKVPDRGTILNEMEGAVMQHFAKEDEVLDHYQTDIATLIGFYFSIAKTDIL